MTARLDGARPRRSAQQQVIAGAGHRDVGESAILADLALPIRGGEVGHGLFELLLRLRALPAQLRQPRVVAAECRGQDAEAQPAAGVLGARGQL